MVHNSEQYLHSNTAKHNAIRRWIPTLCLQFALPWQESQREEQACRWVPDKSCPRPSPSYPTTALHDENCYVSHSLGHHLALKQQKRCSKFFFISSSRAQHTVLNSTCWMWRYWTPSAQMCREAGDRPPTNTAVAHRDLPQASFCLPQSSGTKKMILYTHNPLSTGYEYKVSLSTGRSVRGWY